MARSLLNIYPHSGKQNYSIDTQNPLTASDALSSGKVLEISDAADIQKRHKIFILSMVIIGNRWYKVTLDRQGGTARSVLYRLYPVLNRGSVYTYVHSQFWPCQKMHKNNFMVIVPPQYCNEWYQKHSKELFSGVRGKPVLSLVEMNVYMYVH